MPSRRVVFSRNGPAIPAEPVRAYNSGYDPAQASSAFAAFTVMVRHAEAPLPIRLIRSLAFRVVPESGFDLTK
jgi:hypothetical protein